MDTSTHTCPGCRLPHALKRHCESTGCPPWLCCASCGLRIDPGHGTAIDRAGHPVQLHQPGADT